MVDKNFVNIGDPLDCLQEEAAEVIKAVSKIKRFGWNSYNPYDEKKECNWVKLDKEMYDLKFRMDQVWEMIKEKYLKEGVI